MLSISSSKRNFSKILKNYVNGQWVESKATKHFDIINPATQEIISKVPQTPKDEFDQAVEVAKTTFKTWKDTSVQQRCRIMADYSRLIKEHTNELADLIV